MNPLLPVVAAMPRVEGLTMPKTAHLITERIEVPCSKNGRPGYRWTYGYYVCNPAEGQPFGEAKIYPPVTRREAFALARELFGADCKIVID